MRIQTYILKYKIWFTVLVVVLCIAGFLTYSFTSPKGLFSGLQNDLKAIEPQPEFAYTDLDGNQVVLSDFKGKPLIINSWATWVPFSAQELPLLSAVKEEYKDEITVLAINRMQDKAYIRAFLETLPERPNLIFLVDPNDTFYKAIDGTAMPETVFYNDDGVVIEHYKGVITETVLRENIQKLINK